MKNIIVLTVVFMIVIFSSGCEKDFLQKDSLTQLSASSFWLNEKDAQLGINGIYDVLQDRIMYSGSLNGDSGFPMYDGLSDNLFNNWKYEGTGNFVESRLDPASGWFYSIWAASYRGIARCNIALEKIPTIPQNSITEAKRKSFIAQAKFLRGLFYSNLAIYFEDVPLILQSQLLDDAFVGKNSYNEIKDAVIKDLTEASVDLPNSYPATENGYATKGAALGLLARFQLYNKNFQAVESATQQMLTLGYGLAANYSTLFTPAGETSNEIVFAVKFSQVQSNNGELFSGTFAAQPKINVNPMRNLVNDYYCIDGKPITTSPLYNQANIKLNRDPRLGATVYFNGDIFLTDLNRAFTGNTPTTFGQKKYIRNAASSTGIATFNPGGQDFYILRYADVLLMRAEALSELGRPAEAYPLVNQVRDRVKMPKVEAVEGTGLTKEQMLEVIYHERRVELALEGIRFFDLKRWVKVEDAYKRAINDRVGNYTPIYKGRRSEVFPIPQRDIDANNSLVQNPVWN
jgi:hypothetical protein